MLVQLARSILGRVVGPTGVDLRRGRADVQGNVGFGVRLEALAYQGANA